MTQKCARDLYVLPLAVVTNRHKEAKDLGPLLLCYLKRLYKSSTLHRSGCGSFNIAAINSLENQRSLWWGIQFKTVVNRPNRS